MTFRLKAGHSIRGGNNLLSIDLELLTDKLQGRFFDWNDLHGRTVNGILACRSSLHMQAMRVTDLAERLLSACCKSRALAA